MFQVFHADCCFNGTQNNAVYFSVVAICDLEVAEVTKAQPRWMKALLGKKHQDRLDRELKKQVALTVVGTQTDPTPIQDQEVQTIPTPDLRPIFWEQKEMISKLMTSVRYAINP